jgi:hypothetical protein
MDLSCVERIIDLELVEYLPGLAVDDAANESNEAALPQEHGVARC